jgi:N6-adenosine-specific RNA methylase IME4/ParB-like chromosome segregation protein Spo0J
MNSNSNKFKSNVQSLRGCINMSSESADVKWLAQDIGKHGQLVPIVRNGEEIVDGFRRLAACKMAGVKPAFVDIRDLGAAGSGELVQNIWTSLNGEGRRHLSLNERALLALKMAEGQRLGSNQHSKDAAGSVPMTQAEVAVLTSVSVDTIQRLQKVQALADKVERREEFDEKVKSGQSVSQLLRELEAHEIYLKVNSKAVKQAIKKSGDDFQAMIRSKAKFSVVYADPPWNYGQKMSTAIGAPHGQYALMPLDDIKAMDVRSLAAKDSICWMWVPNCLIKAGIEVLEAWGFEFVTTVVWLKNSGAPTQGAVLPRHETILIGKRGAGLGKDEETTILSTAYYQPVGQHSQKPEHFAEMIEALYPCTAKVELFCRQPRKGWAVFGNQSNGAAIKPTTAGNTAKSRKKPAVKRAVRGGGVKSASKKI